jgi:hypothetical protein
MEKLLASDGAWRRVGFDGGKVEGQVMRSNRRTTVWFANEQRRNRNLKYCQYWLMRVRLLRECVIKHSVPAKDTCLRLVSLLIS